MCAETINTRVSAAEIAGISGGRSVEYEWESGGEKGYTKIGAGKRVKFAVTAESGCSQISLTHAFATLTFIRAVSRKKPLYSFKLT
jgi:hypothetical protein